MAEITPNILTTIVDRLGGWPKYFEAAESEHALGMLELQVRRRSIDEAVFGIVLRYAVHRAEYDRLSGEIAETRDQAEQGEFMSGREQRRAYHKKELLILERELLVTPASKVKAELSLQTDFLDRLEPGEGPEDGGGKILPWQPMSRKAQG